MSVQFNHTIVYARNGNEAATFMADVLGLAAPTPFGPFFMVETSNGVSLDFLSTNDSVAAQHYAFLISELEFDAIFARIQQRGLSYWADPAQLRRGVISHHNGGRGLYFEDPNGHLLEIITRPY